MIHECLFCHKEFDGYVNKVFCSKSCQGKKYYEDNKEKRKESNKRSRQKNEKKLQEKRRAYREQNKEIIKQKSKIFREQNKEKIKEEKRIYYQKNKERLKEKSSKYYKENIEIEKEKRKKYRNLKSTKQQVNERLKIKYKTDAKFRLRCCITKEVKNFLKDKKIFLLHGSIFRILPENLKIILNHFLMKKINSLGRTMEICGISTI